MTLPQIIVDLLTLLFDRAFPSAICTMVLAGIALRQEHSVRRGFYPAARQTFEIVLVDRLHFSWSRPDTLASRCHRRRSPFICWPIQSLTESVSRGYVSDPCVAPVQDRRA